MSQSLQGEAMGEAEGRLRLAGSGLLGGSGCRADSCVGNGTYITAVCRGKCRRLSWFFTVVYHSDRLATDVLVS